MAKSDQADVAAGHANKTEKLSRRQRHKRVNDKHKWPEMPKIQSPKVRAKAYVRVAGLSEPKKVDFDLNDPSVRFGRLLGSADQRIRHQAVLQLESFLKQKCEIRDDDEDNDDDEQEETNKSGISEMDLLKLWKALWHTLYMADKVPVQQELSRKLANLIWCVAGTEEEDEYAAQVYLNMYGDGAVGFDDYDEEDITMEEIENTLGQEFDQDDDEEEDEESADGESEEEEMEEEEMEEEEEEQDEEEEGVDDSEIPHCRGAHLASLFVRTFFRTLRREWGRMDKYRVDKFYSLIRIMIHQVFRYMSLRHWSTGIIRIFNDVLHEEVLSQTPNGLRYHLIDLTLEELAAVNSKAPMPLTEATFLDCMEPYFAMASVDIGDDTVKARVMENIVSKFLEDYSFVSGEPAKDKDGKPLTMDQVHVGTVAEYIFKLAADTDTPDKDRESLYEMHKRYMRAIKKAGKDVDIEGGAEGSEDEQGHVCMDCNEKEQGIEGEESEDEQEEEATAERTKQAKGKKTKKANKKKDREESDDGAVEMEQMYEGDVDTPERPNKRKLAINKDDEEEPVEGSETKKKRKNRKKKKKNHKLDGDGKQEDAAPDQNTKTNKNTVVETKTTAKNEEAAIAQNDSATEDRGDEKRKKKKKKKKSMAEESSSDERAEKSEEITITVADQKAAIKAMKASKVPTEKTAPRKRSNEYDSEGKKVKFGERNMARSWKASMKGLRTMSPISPLPKPDKGILQNRDVKPTVKKVKKMRARKKAADYF